MIEPSGGISGLISGIPGTNRVGKAPLDQGGFGPDFIMDLGRQSFGSVPGYNQIASLNSAATSSLQFQLVANSQPTQVFSEKQVQQLQVIISAATKALNSGDLETAKEKAQELLKRDYNDPIGTHLLGRIAAAKGDLDTAISHFERAAQLIPDNDRFADDLFAAQQLRLGDRAALDTASELTKQRSTAVRGLRLAFQLADRTQSKGEAYLTIAEGFGILDRPVQQLSAFSVALAEGNADDLVELESELKEFITDNDPVGLAHSVLGRTQQRLGKFNEAIQSLKTARTIAPEVLQFSEELANVYATVGNEKLGKNDLNGAEYYFTLARDLDPTNEDLKFGMASVLVSKAKDEINKGRDDNARAQLGRASSILGGDQSLDGEFANAYYRLGRRAQSDGSLNLAQLDFERAFARDPDISGLKRNLAERYRANGQTVLDSTAVADMTITDHRTVVNNFQKAFDLFGSREDYKSTLGEALNNFGSKLVNVNEDYEQAVEILDRARNLYPDNTTYQSNYAQALQLHLANPET